MSYRKIMNENAKDVHNAAIATKIMQLMDIVRDNSHEGQAKRWVWELIQNAKDAAFPDKPTRIKIDLFENRVVFSHNGRPFLVKHLLSIINQVSSKTGSNDGSTGKFGTGFITTHLLSEQVQLDGILQDVSVDTKESLPAKQFSIMLDRSGSHIQEITNSVSRAIAEIQNIDDKPDLVGDLPEYTTSFTYFLESERSKNAAKIGIEDLANTVLYALIFVEKIEKITMINHIQNKEISYQTLSKEESIKNTNITSFTIVEQEGQNSTFHHLMRYKNGKNLLAVPIDSNKNLLNIHNSVARIFVDFPLIGSEKFPFPVVLCNSDLLPDEPRSWIPLSRNSESKNSVANKMIMEQALQDCLHFFEQLKQIGCRQFYKVCLFSHEPIQRNDFDQEWYDKKMIDGFWNGIANYEIIEMGNGYCSLKKEGLCIPMSHSQKEFDKLYQLLSKIQGLCLPRMEEALGWNYALWRYGKFRNISFDIRSILRQLNMFFGKFETRLKKIQWLQEFYDICLENGKIKSEILENQIAIFPDQQEEFQLHTVYDIKSDPNIDELIKKASEKIDQIHRILYERSRFYARRTYVTADIYKQLLEKEFDTHDISIENYEYQELFQYVKDSTELTLYRGYFSIGNVQTLFLDAAFCMVACYQTDTLHELCKFVLEDRYNKIEYKASGYATTNTATWKNAVITIQYTIGRWLEQFTNIERLHSKLKMDKVEKTEEWLIQFIQNCGTMLMQNTNALDSILGEIKMLNIVPNQEGLFCRWDQLYQDDNIDDGLKKIAKLLSKSEKNSVPNYYQILMTPKIKLDQSIMSKYNDSEVANRIRTAIDKMFNNGGFQNTDDDMREACTYLLTWIDEHIEKANEYFPAFVSEEGRSRLLTPQAVVRLTRKNQQIDKMLTKIGVSNIEELEEKINSWQQSQSINHMPNLENWKWNMNGDRGFFIDDRSNYSSDEEFENRCRAIGKAGERIVFDSLVEEEKKKGSVIKLEEQNKVILCNENGEEIEIELADKTHYTQAGFDIKRTVYCKDTQEKQVIVYEVKSTVIPESMSFIELSKAQFSESLKRRQNFYLVRLLLHSKTLDCLKMIQLNDIPEQLALSSLEYQGGRVTFYMV